jgi:hypothetical protein
LFRIPWNNFFVGKWQPYIGCLGLWTRWTCSKSMPGPPLRSLEPYTVPCRNDSYNIISQILLTDFMHFSTIFSFFRRSPWNNTWNIKTGVCWIEGTLITALKRPSHKIRFASNGWTGLGWDMVRWTLTNYYSPFYFCRPSKIIAL